MSTRRAALASIVFAAMLAAGCNRGGTQFNNTDVTGAEFGRGFELTDHKGVPRTLADFSGKVVTIFFGYTQCPDVCPTTLSEMREVMELLGPRADRVQALFITVDPERDTQELLAHYVPAFDARFIGLYGTPEATARVAKDFRVFYQKVPGSTPGSYSVDHTAGSYVYDPKGRLRLFVKHGQGAKRLADDIAKLIDGA